MAISNISSTYFRWMITKYLTPEYFLCIEILSISHLPPWKHLDFFCWVVDNNNEFIQIRKKGNFYRIVSSYWNSSKFFFLRPDLLSKIFFRDSVINKYCLKGLGSEKSWMLKNDFTYLTFKAKDIEYQVCHIHKEHLHKKGLLKVSRSKNKILEP